MKNLYLICAFLLCLTVNAQCLVNGNFESGITANYTFRINPETNEFTANGCTVNTLNYLPVTMPTTTNQFEHQGGTLVDGTSVGNYGVFDQTLFDLGTFMYRVSPSTGGTRAMKLNASSGGADISTMTVQVNSAPQNIMFDYSIVTQNPHPDRPNVQPFFAVRMYNATTGVMIYDGFCVKADASSPQFVETNTGDVLYTDWQCGSLPVPAANVGQNIRLEFVISDCGEGGHFGTVYIDNIRCGTTCNVFGEIVLNEVKRSCPSQPFNVCGSFINPTNATIINNSIALSIVDENGITTVLNLTPTITGNTFCFSINPTLFGSNPSGQFEFRVRADFQGPSGVFRLWGAAPAVGPDVIFGPLSPSLNSVVTPTGITDVLTWDDVDESYTLEFRADGVCCPGAEPGSTPDPAGYYSVTTTDNFINLNTVSFNTGGARCFRWRIKTSCGWSGWCCLSSLGTEPGDNLFRNRLAPNCYIGDLCEDVITISNASENTVTNGHQLAVYKDISITAYNSILSGGLGMYSAGSFVLLTPGFNAASGSIFTAVIDECTGEDIGGLGTTFRTSGYSESEEANSISTNSVIASDSFTVYPNPTKGIITVTGKTVEVFTVIDINGKELMRIEQGNSPKDYNIDLSGLTTGIYFLTADGKTIQKVIKE